MKKITRFFWWCAGARPEILESCPTDHAKYFGIGGTILFTALMACFAGGFAFFTAFKSVTVTTLSDGSEIENIAGSSYLFASLFGLFWGSMIFNLDRYIVSTIKDDGTSKITKEEWFNAAPRLIMAVLLGFVISTPLELKLFEREIKYEIKEIIKDNRNVLNEKDSSYVNEKAKYLQQKAQLEQDQRDAISGQTLSPEKIQLSNVNERITQLENQKRGADAAYRLANARYQTAYANCLNTINGEENAKVICNQKTSALAYQRNLKAREVNRLNNLIQSAVDSKNAIASNDIDNLKALRTRNQQQIDALNSKIDNIDKILISNKATADAESKKYGGFMASIEAYSRLKDKHLSLALVGFFITLLFIFIEVAPVLFKLMTEAGPYDDIIKRIKHEVAVSEMQRISDLNDKINTDITISSERNKGRMDAELRGNKELLEAIALAQADIAKRAVDKWKDVEIKKLDRGVRHIISSNDDRSLHEFENRFWKYENNGEEHIYCFKNGSSNEVWLKFNGQLSLGKWLKLGDKQIEVDINDGKRVYNIDELTDSILRISDHGTGEKMNLQAV